MRMKTIKAWLATVLLLALAACGGGGGSDAGNAVLPGTGSGVGSGAGTGTTVAKASVQVALSSTSISSATPATVTATLKDSKGAAVAGQVLTFTVVRGLAKTNVGTALTDKDGNAFVVLSPASSTVAGADEVTASTTFAGVELLGTKGFQVQATNVTLSALTSAIANLGAYGQTTLSLGISGASVGAPVNVALTSSCVSQGKATLSPATFAATTASVDFQYKDAGCGAVRSGDKIQAVIVGTANSAVLDLPIAKPAAASVAFVSASPDFIYIKGSGFIETAVITFEVRDDAGNVLPNLQVVLELLTEGGGVTMQGATRATPSSGLKVEQTSDALGRVTARVNSGTIPAPVRVAASLKSNALVATVSSNLNIAIGLPSQLNFSLSQQTRNIEGFDIDGTPNAYTIIASDRVGNPVAPGTSVNFVAEGGQIEPPVQKTPLPAGGISRLAANFVSSNPRPADGRVTITAYALGEESFIDQNGNNRYDLGEPFQDLGDVFKDRIFDGVFDRSVDEFLPTNIANTLVCLTPAGSAPAFDGQSGANAATSALLALDASAPSVGGSTCDGVWSRAGSVYVRRSIETVLSTSVPRILWAGTSGLDSSCRAVTLQTGPQPSTVSPFNVVTGGETWYSSGASTSLAFIVADRNTFQAVSAAGAVGRLNPMAAGTTISASTPTQGLIVTLGGGSPVPSTGSATLASVGVAFDTATAGVVFVTFTSPSGVGTTYAINVQQTSALNPKPSDCP